MHGAFLFVYVPHSSGKVYMSHAKTQRSKKKDLCLSASLFTTGGPAGFAALFFCRWMKAIVIPSLRDRFYVVV